MGEPGVLQKLMRYSFIAFNVLFTVIGLGLVIAGSYGVAQAKSIDIEAFMNNISIHVDHLPKESEEGARSALIGVAGVIITIGLITMLISSCGWLGACKQNTCLLFSFSVSLVIIVLLEFILGISVLVVVKKFADPDSDENHQWTSTLISATRNNSQLETAWDVTQKEGHCCGINGPDDWKEESLPIRPSCIDPDTKQQYNMGCFEAYKESLLHIASAVGGVAIGFCVIEIIGIVISCYLACTMRKSSHYEQK